MDTVSVIPTPLRSASLDDEVVIGIDIGGTKIAAGIVDRHGKIRLQTRTPMVANDGAQSGLSAVITSISSTLAQVDASKQAVRAIGVCSPGPLDPVAGTVINPPNLPCWRNFPLALELAKFYNLPVKLDNDANAAALAEVLWGSGRGYRNVFYTTIGTGIGTGIVFDGRIYHGRTGSAAEGGHMSIDPRGPRCGCGKPGCIEAFASGPAIALRARAKLLEADHIQSAGILQLANGDSTAVTCEMVAKSYQANDPLAQEVLIETISLLAIWLSNIVDLLEPDVIIIGGGVAQMLSPLFGQLRTRISEYCVNSRAREIPLLMAQYGAQAGIAGAAALCATNLAVAPH